MITRKTASPVVLKKIGKDLYVPIDFVKHHHYYADPQGDKEYTGVTTILGCLAKPQLIPWASRMCAEYMQANFKPNTTYTEGEIVALCKRAQGAHAAVRDDAAAKGTDTHALVESFVKDCIKNHKGKPIALFDPAIKQFAEWAAGEKLTFLAAERQMYSKKLFVAGTVDIVFSKGGKTYVCDIKTYAKIWDRTPFFQAAGYGLMFQESEKKVIDGYCVVRLSKDGSFEVLWSFDVKGDTDAFLACVTLYRTLKAFNSIKVK